MSSIAEKVAPLLTPDQESASGTEEKQVKRKRDRPYKPRLATTVKWHLEDSMKELDGAEQRMGNVLAWLEETFTYEMDDRARAHLGKLQLELLALELHVSKARQIVATSVTECKPAK